MTPSEYKLINFLQRINKKYIKEKKLSEITLKEFCKHFLSDSIAAIRFAAMYEMCNDRPSPNKQFHNLSRYIDQTIVTEMDSVPLFRRYDNMMVNIMDRGEESQFFIEYDKLCKKYKTEGFEFNSIIIPKMKPKNKKLQKPQKFDPVNLF